MLSSELPTMLLLLFANVFQTLIDVLHISRKMFSSNKEQTKVDIATSRLETLAEFAKACYTTLRMGG